MNNLGIIVILLTALAGGGCYGHEVFLSAARARAAAEYKCTPGAVVLTPMPELGFEVMKVEACGHSAQYACIHCAGGQITCVHEGETK